MFKAKAQFFVRVHACSTKTVCMPIYMRTMHALLTPAYLILAAV